MVLSTTSGFLTTLFEVTQVYYPFGHFATGLALGASSFLDGHCRMRGDNEK